MNKKLSSYRPAVYHYRQIAREGTEEEVRAALIELSAEHERLRAWVREQRMVPPRWTAPESWSADAAAMPATLFQAELARLARSLTVHTPETR